MLTTAGFRRLVVSSRTLESAHPGSAMTGMVFRLVPVGDPVGDPVVVAEVAAVVLDPMGVVIAVMVLAMDPCSLKGSAHQGRGTSGWIYMLSSLPLALSWFCTRKETWGWRQNTDSLVRHWTWVKWLKHVNLIHNINVTSARLAILFNEFRWGIILDSTLKN
jgi:hypothetical protein